MSNDYTTFFVDSSFPKRFTVRDLDLSRFGTPKGIWKFEFFNDRTPNTDSLTATRVRQNGTDVEIDFEVPRTFFQADMVGSIQYQVILEDADNADPQYKHLTPKYIGEIKAPL